MRRSVRVSVALRMSVRCPCCVDHAWRCNSKNLPKREPFAHDDASFPPRRCEMWQPCARVDAANAMGAICARSSSTTVGPRGRNAVANSSVPSAVRILTLPALLPAGRGRRHRVRALARCRTLNRRRDAMKEFVGEGNED
jgi:hypothetical protein